MLQTCHLHDLLDFLHPVLRVDLAVLSHVCDVRAQHCQGFAAATSHTHQQSVAKCGGDDSDDFDDMLDGYHEEDKVHLVGGVEVVVLLEI